MSAGSKHQRRGKKPKNLPDGVGAFKRKPQHTRRSKKHRDRSGVDRAR